MAEQTVLASSFALVGFLNLGWPHKHCSRPFISSKVFRGASSGNPKVFNKTWAAASTAVFRMSMRVADVSGKPAMCL